MEEEGPKGRGSSYPMSVEKKPPPGLGEAEGAGALAVACCRWVNFSMTGATLAIASALVAA